MTETPADSGRGWFYNNSKTTQLLLGGLCLDLGKKRGFSGKTFAGWTRFYQLKIRPIAPSVAAVDIFIVNTKVVLPAAGLGCFFIFCLAATPTLQAQSNLNLRVMAANLNGNSQKYEPFAIRIFQGLKPDVIAIQEFNYTSTNGVDANNAAAFREMVDLAFGTNFVYFRENYSGIPNGVISRYPIDASGSWPDPVQTQPNRGFAWAKIALPGTNFLYVVSVHLLTSGDRTAEAVALKTNMVANFPPNAWVIVAGDFNASSRTEGSITTFNGYLSDYPVPVDNVGNSFTSGNRNAWHDFVLPSLTLTNIETATVLPSHSFPSGLVFDSHVYTPLSDVPPVLLPDSTNAQHMAVMKDFLIPVSGTVTTNAPAITTQPASQTNSVGANVTFSVSATGTAPLAYQWRFFGTNLGGATLDSFSLTNIQATNAGDYTVVVTNSAGSITSSIAKLTVVAGPTITNQPQSLAVLVGQNATFTVGASGAAPLNYQWRFNSTNNLTDATNNAYTRANAQLSDAGNYTVVVTNASGSLTSSIAVLTISEPTTGTLTTLAGWDVSGSTNFGSSPLPPSTNAANLTVVGLTRGSGVLTPAGAAARAWGGTGWDSASAAAAVTAGDFATLSIAANPGYKVSFSAISKFDYRHSSTGPANGVLQYQIGAGAFTDIATLAYPISTSSGAAVSALDLSGIAALQNVAANTVVTLRIVNYGASGSGGTWYVFDFSNSAAPDFAVQGIVSSLVISNPPAAAPALTNAALSGSQFQFLLTGTSGSNYIVQGTTNLGPANWISLRTNAAPFTFVESNFSNLPQRFYRGLVAP